MEALSYEWTKYSASLFEPDEELQQGYKMRKGCKSAFYSAIKDKISDIWLETEALLSGQRVVYIIDGMAFIQKHSVLGAEHFMQLRVF